MDDNKAVYTSTTCNSKNEWKLNERVKLVIVSFCFFVIYCQFTNFVIELDLCNERRRPTKAGEIYHKRKGKLNREDTAYYDTKLTIKKEGIISNKNWDNSRVNSEIMESIYRIFSSRSATGEALFHKNNTKVVKRDTHVETGRPNLSITVRKFSKKFVNVTKSKTSKSTVKAGEIKYIPTTATSKTEAVGDKNMKTGEEIPRPKKTVMRYVNPEAERRKFRKEKKNGDSEESFEKEMRKAYINKKIRRDQEFRNAENEDKEREKKLLALGIIG